MVIRVIQCYNRFLEPKENSGADGVGSSIGRASDCESDCCGFESRPIPHIYAVSLLDRIPRYERGGTGSTPVLRTKKLIANARNIGEVACAP